MSDAPDSKAAFLTVEHVEKWKTELQAFDQQIVSTRKQIEDLNLQMNQISQERAKREHTLRQAAPFVPGLTEWLDMFGQEDVPLTNAIKSVLQRHRNQPLNREVIKMQLPTAGYALQKLNANPNYFYIALKRLQERGEIAEGPQGHFRLK